MDQADTGIVFYSDHALQLKRMPPLPKEKVKEGFEKNNLIVLTSKDELENWLKHHDYFGANLLLMSSGNFDGMDLLKTVAPVPERAKASE